MPEFEPHTRNEALLNAIRENTGGGTGSVDFEPHSRNEYLLNEIRKNTEGGGGSGLPDVSDSDNGKVLGVENGAWGKVDAPTGLPDASVLANDQMLITDNNQWATAYYYRNTVSYDFTDAAGQVVPAIMQTAISAGSEIAWYMPLDATMQAETATLFSQLRDVSEQSVLYGRIWNYSCPLAYHMDADATEPSEKQIEMRFTIPSSTTLCDVRIVLTMTNAFFVCKPITTTLIPLS